MSLNVDAIWAWLGSQSAPLQAAGALVGLVIAFAALARFVWRAAWPLAHFLLLLPFYLVAIIWQIVVGVLGFLPLRIVTTGRLAEYHNAEVEAFRLRRDLAELRTAAEPTSIAPMKRPLTLRERCDRLAALLEESMAEWDHADPKLRPGYHFRFLDDYCRELLVPLRRAGKNPDAVFTGPMTVHRDPTRAEAEEVRDYLRGLTWDEG